ncbi:Bug family tripartite tricarboxylate transporter substrate binding protein [Bradyrhizobium sp. AZCC 2289]|uniref:Bug family tripartite tricarboxylate transporter substrate binding protein n=1 Tax=Bradyrhizobium sp. AZCC 2289 TaxID=3117026 RepID=UPI002FF185CB
MRMRDRYSLIAACLGLLAIVAPASAQEDVSKYPSRAIHIIVGFAAGGGNDIIARVFGQKLSESLGQPVIVENKPGGGAIVATEYVAKSAPDGYTLLMSASGISINPAVYAKLPYDAVNDFVAVSELASFPLIMVVNASSPIKSVAELVTYAKANPDKMNYASSSASFQLVTELFKQKTGAPMQVIPYKSANESVLAVISGQVTTTIADAGPVLSQVKAGTVRALAVAAPKRMEDLPDVPTLKEAGADVDAVLWSGIFVPKATSPEIVKRLEGELMQIAKLPDVIARLKLLGIDTVGNSSNEFAKILAADLARWGAVAKASNIKIEQ